jgi:type II secretion system protein N
MNSSRLNQFGKLLHHPVSLCFASFIACLFIGLLLFLPLDPFARQLEHLAQQQGLELRIDDPQMLFPLGLGASELNISHSKVPHPPFQLQDIDLRPLWFSLIGSNPGLSFELKAYQGEINGVAYRDGKAEVALANLQFDEPLGSQLPLSLEGLLEKGEFNGTLPLAGKNQSRLLLEFDGLSLKGMRNVGSGSDILQLGRLSCTAEAKGPLVQIGNLRSNGPAFDLKGNGSLRLGRIAANSSLNLNLVLTPKSALDPALKDLLSLLKKPQTDGSYQLSLRGALSNLRIN